MRWRIATEPAGPLTAGKGIAVATCGLLVVAQFLLFSHAALVEHRVCALHGESIHTVTPPSPAMPRSAHSSARPQGLDAQDHEHEHCLCMGQARERFLPSAQAHDEAPLPMLSPRSSMPAIVRSAVTIALWALAPKHSPPA